MPWIKVVALIGGLVALVWAVMNLNIRREKTIEAGDIVVSQVSNTSEIKGSFKVYTPWLKHNNTILSKGTGGACLVANLNPIYPGVPDISGVPRTRRCSLNSECQKGLETGWFGYCDAGAGTGICWVKPGGDEFCNKSNMPPEFPPPIIWQDGITNTVPKSTHYFQASTSNIHWRVVACLNGIDHTGESTTDCRTGGSNRIEVFGSPTPVKYKPF